MFLIRRRTPRSTLFPYTTLFRSLRGRRRHHRRGGDHVARGREGCRRPRGGGDQRPGDRRLLGEADRRGDAPRSRDRKSTRLNSSHMSISYAVFCLKKKKQTPIVV